MVSSLAFPLCAPAADTIEQERLTIVTYYPTPSGTYNQLTTTGNTYLATSGGGVGIGIGAGATAPNTLLQVGTLPSPGLFINSSGNVGVGKTNPAYALDVEGDVYVNGNIVYDGGGESQIGYNGTLYLHSTSHLFESNHPCILTVQQGIITAYSSDCNVVG
jgi:hypothetical protein